MTALLLVILSLLPPLCYDGVVRSHAHPMREISAPTHTTVALSSAVKTGGLTEIGRAHV